MGNSSGSEELKNHYNNDGNEKDNDMHNNIDDDKDNNKASNSTSSSIVNEKEPQQQQQKVEDNNVKDDKKRTLENITDKDGDDDGTSENGIKNAKKQKIDIQKNNEENVITIDESDNKIERTKTDPAAAAIEINTTNNGNNQEQKNITNSDSNDNAPPSLVASLVSSENNGEDNNTKDTNNNNTSSNKSENVYGKLRWIIVENDGKSDSMIKLIGLKSLFAKQLPKMPRAYIARLVLDRRHTSLAILSDNVQVQDSDDEIIGGICYRAFPSMRFAEIAFCAVNSTHQVKGYGTKLMNLLKQIAAKHGIEYLITYADNYAIGYFKKQGFTKNITMSKGRYVGLIKDYDGGTPMECYIHPSIDFTRITDMIRAQRTFLLKRIELSANSLKVYPPYLNTNDNDNNKNNNEEFGVLSSRGNSCTEAAKKALIVPGVIEAGWTLSDLLPSNSTNGNGKDVNHRAVLKQELLQLIRKMEEQQFVWPFREPVDVNEVPDYLDVIENPIDLKTMEKRVRDGNHYKNKHMLFADVMLMVNNCKLYNEDGSTYTQCAIALEKFAKNIFQDVITSSSNSNNNNGGGGGGQINNNNNVGSS